MRGGRKLDTVWDRDREAEAARIYTQYRRLLDTVARSILRQYPEDCEECVQDAIWSYVSGADKWDPERGSEQTYLCVLTRSRAKDRLRRLSARREEPLEDYREYLTAGDQMEREAVREGLRRALAELSTAERRLFTLRFLYQWPSQEIGGVMGISAGAVDARTARLRKKLKRLLARQGLGMGKEREDETV